MELFIGLVIAGIAYWVWRTRKYDHLTNSDFDAWLALYATSSSPFEKSGMAVAFLQQSIHLAWSLGAINGKQKDLVTAHLKQREATATVMEWLESVLPYVARSVGEREIADTPARTVGMLMLIGWMAEDNPEHAIRRFMLHRHR